MTFKIAILSAGLALTLVTGTLAAAADVTGRVLRVDPGAQVIVLDDNRAYRLTPNTVVLIDDRPVALGGLQPGQTVVIRSGEPLTVAPSDSPPTVQAPPGSTIVVQSQPPAGPRQTIYGRLTDVDRGEVKIKTDGGHFEVKVPRDVTAQLRKGDNVRLDITFMPS